MFINEFVSEDNIVAKDLDTLRRKYNPMLWKNGRPQGFAHSWTICRALSAYLYFVKSITRIGNTGRAEPTNHQVVILNLRDINYEFEIDKDRQSSVYTTDNPYIIRWILVREPSDYIGSSREEAIRILKEALLAYGQQGIYLQVKNTVIDFGF